LTPAEVQEAASIVEEIIDPDVNLIWWMSLDETMEDEVQVTIIATWFQEQSKEPIIKQVTRDMLWRPKTESFIDRAIRTSTNQEAQQTTQNDTFDSKFNLNNNDDEDYETPSFITKKLNDWNN
jgi:cell division protein FtsZ